VRVVTPAAASSAEDTMLVAPDSAAAENGNHGEEDAPAAAAVAPVPAGLVPAAATTAVGREGISRSAPPRVQIRPDATAGPAGRRSAPPPRGSLLEEPPRRQWGGRLLLLVGVLVGVAFVIVVLLKVTANNNTLKPTSVAQKSKTTATKSNSTPFNAHDVMVSVLNGTSVVGLAQDVSNALAKHGYRAGSITNAAVQTQKTTVVYYVQNEKSAAQHVAKTLKLKPASVLPATQAVIQSCSTTPAATCQGEVIVSVGADRASLASNAASA